MKQLQINTGKATILAVELPKGAKNLVVKDAVKLGENHSIYPTIHYSFEGDKVIVLPQGNWKPLGFADEIKKDQLDLFIDNLTKGSSLNLYRNYKYDIPQPVAFTFTDITDSFNSLLKANGVVSVNPLGTHDQHCSTASEAGDYGYLSREWQQAESELWTNPVILLKQ
jgi:hypothetical protein